jgi:hypothetical protein
VLGRRRIDPVDLLGWAVAGIAVGAHYSLLRRFVRTVLAR